MTLSYQCLCGLGVVAYGTQERFCVQFMQCPSTTQIVLQLSQCFTLCSLTRLVDGVRAAGSALPVQHSARAAAGMDHLAQQAPRALAALPPAQRHLHQPQAQVAHQGRAGALLAACPIPSPACWRCMALVVTLPCQEIQQGCMAAWLHGCMHTPTHQVLLQWTAPAVV